MNNLRTLNFFFVIYLLLSILNISPVLGISSKGLSLFTNYLSFACLLAAFFLSKPFSPHPFSIFLFKRGLKLPLFIILFYLTGIIVAVFDNNYGPLLEVLPLMVRCSISIFILAWLFCYLLTEGKYLLYIKIITVLLIMAVSSILILNFLGIELSYIVDTDLDKGDDIIGRSSGFFINANIAAQYSVFAVIFLLYFFEAGKPKFYYKAILLVLILCCTFASILTFSTTGFINLLIVFVYFIFSKYTNKIKFVFHFILVLTVFQLAVLSLQSYSSEFYFTYSIPQIQQEKIDNFLNIVSFNKTEKIDYSSRDDLLRKGIEKVIDRPFFGYGAGSFNVGVLNGLGAHNTYLQIIGEAGFFLLAIYIALIISILIRCVKIKNKGINFLLSASFLTIMSYQVTTHGVLYSEGLLLMMVLINCVSMYVNYVGRFKSNNIGVLKSFHKLNV